jgi:hypothetical protein
MRPLATVSRGSLPLKPASGKSAHAAACDGTVISFRNGSYGGARLVSQRIASIQRPSRRSPPHADFQA